MRAFDINVTRPGSRLERAVSYINEIIRETKTETSV